MHCAKGTSYRPSTLRQTQVVVIPGNDIFREKFSVFDDLIIAMNEARRCARDFVTEAHWERLDAQDDNDDEDEEWSVGVNCAHLHPLFAEHSSTTEQSIKGSKQQKQQQEEAVDMEYQEYQKRRLLARQSPYPTVVIEVRANPSPDFNAASLPTPTTAAGKGDTSVTAADILKLEHLFGRSAHMNHPTKHTTQKQEEEAFYSSIGGSIQELSAVSPLTMAQNYMDSADPTIPSTAAFTESNTELVDEAYEFIFSNIAMMAETVKQQSKSNFHVDQDVRHYVVLPRFVTSAATSLEKFAQQCQSILKTIPDLTGRVEIQTYHPEHVHEAKRSPIPIVLLRWNSNQTDASTD